MSNYQFRSQPRAVAATGVRKKYRDPNEKQRPVRRQNLMNDRRVVRGNTHAVIVANPFDTFQPRSQQTNKARRNRTRRRQILQNAAKKSTMAAEEALPLVPEPQVEENPYEELDFDGSAALPDNVDYQDLPPEPEFVPKPAGISTGTSVEEEYVFDFDMSVEPVLEVLVGKCMDQSIAEVLEERERKYLKAVRAEYDVLKTLAFASVETLKAECIRRNEEKHRRFRQERDRKIKERVIAHKVSSRKSTASTLQALQAEVLGRLEKRGVFFDPVTHEVQNIFLPWLVNQVGDQLQVVADARGHVDVLIADALNHSVQELVDAKDAERQKAEEKIKQKADRKALAKYIVEERARRKAADEQFAQDVAEDRTRQAEARRARIAAAKAAAEAEAQAQAAQEDALTSELEESRSGEKDGDGATADS